MENKSLSSAIPKKSKDQKDILDDIRKRHKKASGIASLWHNILEACFHYAIPFRNRFYKPKPMQGDLEGSSLYDTTAVDAMHTFVSKMQDAMTPPQTQWGFFEPETKWAEENPDMVEDALGILESYGRKLFSYIHKSNFDVVINECYFDLGCGTSAIVVNQGNDISPLMFTSIPIDQLAIEEGVDGKINTWYRTWQDLKIAELGDRWKGIKINSSLEQKLKSDPDATANKVYEGVTYYPGEAKKFLYSVWVDGDNGLLLSQWTDSNPGIVWRFQKTNNETWGRGPVMNALPSIISCNEMARIELASANLNTFRPYMGFTDTVFNPHSFKLRPFEVIPIAPMSDGSIAPLQPLPNSASPEFGQLMIQDLRLQIKRAMFAEEPTDTKGVQPQTAFELSMKEQTLAQRIGPLFSRQEHEFLEPIIFRCAYVLDKMGILPKPQMEGVPVKFKYKSPLELARGLRDASGIGEYFQMLQGILGQTSQLYINQEKLPYIIADKLQIDSRMIRPYDEVKEEAKMIQQQVMVQQAMQGGEQGGGTEQ